MAYKLNAVAELELEEILDYGVDTWGIHQALKFQSELKRIFELLAVTPEMGKKAPEFSTENTQAYSHPHKPYLVVYKIHDNRDVEILSLAPARTDWKKS